MRLRSAFFVGLPLLLACAGLSGEPTDSADTGAGPEPEPEDEWTQSSDCEDYLACLKAVDRDEWESARDHYGADGDCWGTDDNVATECDDECEEGLAELAADNPDEPDCVESEDTGTDTDTGGDTGSGGDCALAAGVWTFSMTWDGGDECGLAGAWVEQEFEVYCEGDLTMEATLLGSFPMSFTCDQDGSAFVCTGDESGFYLALEGDADGNGTSAEGTIVFQIDASCASLGSFNAALD